MKINTTVLNGTELWQLKWIEDIPQVISVAVEDCFYFWGKEKWKILLGARHRWSTPSAPTFDSLLFILCVYVCICVCSETILIFLAREPLFLSELGLIFGLKCKSQTHHKRQNSKCAIVLFHDGKIIATWIFALKHTLRHL